MFLSDVTGTCLTCVSSISASVRVVRRWVAATLILELDRIGDLCCGNDEWLQMVVLAVLSLVPERDCQTRGSAV